MSKNAIVSFANSRGNYVKGLERLHESLRNNFDGDFVGFVGESAVGSPLHSENPYAFKVHCFKKMLDQGYRKILYLDSSVFAIKNVQPCFDEIEKDGFLFQEAGHILNRWCNRVTLNYFGITEEQAEIMIMIGNAGMLGLDFDNHKAVQFFERWEASMNDGFFKGSWDDHRHDMSCSSAIINKMGLINLAKKGDQWLQYATVFQETANGTIIFKAAGM